MLRMLKDGAKILTEPILQIVNMSLDSKFPLGCKTATEANMQKGKIADLLYLFF